MILGQCSLKVKNDCPKIPKQAEAKRDGVINPQITISINFNTENFVGHNMAVVLTGLTLKKKMGLEINIH